ncbi:MAG: DUF4279 domain-containing protein [Verrucomicrobiales bacterium]|nr:DUF4279 domain-containing protein [Verrucomicrobiales bacterium]
MSLRAYACLGLSRDFDIGKITPRIGLKPSKPIAKHTKVPERGIPKTALLRYAQSHSEDDVPHVIALADEVVRALEPCSADLGKIVEADEVQTRLEVGLVVVVVDKRGDLSTPAIGFSTRAVAFLAQIQPYIDVDTYFE